MGNRIRVLRAERNWSQSDLAERLAVSLQSVNGIETGKYGPLLPLTFRLAELFGFAIEDMFLPPSRFQPKALKERAPPMSDRRGS